MGDYVWKNTDHMETQKTQITEKRRKKLTISNLCEFMCQETKTLRHRTQKHNTQNES